MIVDVLIGSLLSSALILGVLGFLGRTVVLSWFDKKLKEHQEKLTRETNALQEKLTRETLAFQERLSREGKDRERRHEVVGRLSGFIHFVLTTYDSTNRQSREEFAKRYWDLVPWLRRDMVKALSDCVADNGRFQGDVRLFLELARREINDLEANTDEPKDFCLNMLAAEALIP